MPPLAPELRRELERTVVAARVTAEAGARAALEALAVHHHEPYGHMARSARDLRNALRAHARQLGDRRESNRGTQAIDRLVQECAYEHWHRMLFARFLAENDLLIEPESKVALSLEECRELAREQGVDPWELASRFAQHMLPAIFRPEDPVLQVPLSREDRMRLEGLLEELPAGTFRADDSLGWVYQFWQTQRKDEVNASGDKIGPDELPAVTQLFTEHYMVLFLLHNTLGAWHAGKVLASKPELANDSTSEDELRAACVLPGYAWEYLRFLRDDGGPWRPAAGTYEGWPQSAAQITVMDPCCGSGHFLVAAFEALVRLRMYEEELSLEAAVPAVLKDNLHGLEIDLRCTQLAAFAVAFAAWRALGRAVPLPTLKIACSGLAVSVNKDEWVKLAGNDGRLQAGMKLLYDQFEQAPTLGSLIDPKRVGAGDFLIAEFHALRPLLEEALVALQTDNEQTELAVTAQGLAHAAELLAGQYTLVVTNVPYLLAGKMSQALRRHLEDHYSTGKNDLAYAMVLRWIEGLVEQGTAAVVVPMPLLFMSSYEALRRLLLNSYSFGCLARLGPHAFQEVSGEVVRVALLTITRKAPRESSTFCEINTPDTASPSVKAETLLTATPSPRVQRLVVANPEARFTLSEATASTTLGKHVDAFIGLQTSDNPRFAFKMWETPRLDGVWVPFQSPTDTLKAYGGRDSILRWDNGAGDLQVIGQIKGTAAWQKRGVLVRLMSDLPATLYDGAIFEQSSAALIPRSSELLLPVWTFCSSPEFVTEVRRIDQALKITNKTFEKISFDLAEWQSAAERLYPNGLPSPRSDDPTQWLFSGHPKGSEQPLHVAVARLLGYQWPRLTGSSFPDSPALGSDGLESLADKDGIVCLPAVRGEDPAAERLRALLHAAHGSEWSPAKELGLIAATDSGAKSLEEWFRDDFFAQHCALFDKRPFVWHIWDGRKDGFHALVNYHRLAEPHGRGRKLLESLAYSYLGDWIARQKAAVEGDEPGAEDRLDAAQELQSELVKILEGEPPYDIFVRWKPLQEQPVGWEPDINDGVRVNIRPFMSAELSRGRAGAGVLRWKPNIKWDKDRGKEPERPKDQYPWFWSGKTFTGERWNDRHLTRAEKMAARDARKKGAS